MRLQYSPTECDSCHRGQLPTGRHLFCLRRAAISQTLDLPGTSQPLLSFVLLPLLSSAPTGVHRKESVTPRSLLQREAPNLFFDIVETHCYVFTPRGAHAPVCERVTYQPHRINLGPFGHNRGLRQLIDCLFCQLTKVSVDETP